MGQYHLRHWWQNWRRNKIKLKQKTIGLKTEAGTVVAAGVVAAEAEKPIDADIVAAEAGTPIDADTVAVEAETEEAATDDIEVPAVRGRTADTDAVEAEKNIGAVTVEVEAEAEREVVEVPGREAGARITEMIGIKSKPAVKRPATRKESKALKVM